MDTVKCRLKHCLHASREVQKDQAIKVGSSYYHPDCYQANRNIREIIDIFSKKINPNVVFAELNRVVSTIVYDKGIDSGLLLFGLKYYIEHGKNLNYPQGLYYVVQNKDVVREYEKSKAMDLAKEVKEKTTIESEEGGTFTHIASRNKGFADILK